MPSGSSPATRKSPWGLWHRAYVEALIGLHKKALDDLAGAEKLARGEDGPKTPEWVDTLEAYCHFDLARLKKVDGPRAKFAAFLRMLAFEFPRHSDVPLRSARELLSFDPECFRAVDVMYQVGGVANLHVATTYPLQLLTDVVPKRIWEIESLPAVVLEPIDRQAGEVALVEVLVRAGGPGEDEGEPSWAVFGHLIRETRFVQVQHRLDFMRNWWSVPVDEFWDEARPLVAGHRYQPYLVAMALGTPQADQAFADSFDEAWLPDLEFTEQKMTGKLGGISEENRKTAWRLTQNHMDHLVKDFATQCALFSKDNKVLWIHNANKILTLSPENPYAMSLLVEVDWETSSPVSSNGRRRPPISPRSSGRLGRRYSEMRRYEKARVLLERYIAESPEHWAFERLAENYREQGDREHWLATLDRYLAEGDDHGLDQAKVRVEIANYTSRTAGGEGAALCRGRRGDVGGLGDEFAPSGAMSVGGLGARRALGASPLGALSELVGGANRLDFCRRTGHGDVEAAQGSSSNTPRPSAPPNRRRRLSSNT